MTTIAKRKNRKSIKQTPKEIAPAIAEAEMPTGEHLEIEVSLIDFSPKNYRKIFKQGEIEELADSIKTYGLIHALTVRQTGERYELVSGERRLRAAGLAGVIKLPVVVRELTDEQANEIRLAENLKRVDPHPLEEALLIAEMQGEGKSLEEVALRIGKSKAFVYNRIKLAGLIEPIQEMFIENKINILEATDIAALAAESQQQFFNDYCKKWKQKDFGIHNLRNILSRYKYDLRKAPFDTKDKHLKPAMGACTNCPFNSATLKSLFPEFAKEAVCNNKACYKDKCIENTVRNVRKAIADKQPDALLVNYALSEEAELVLQSLPETDSLPRVNFSDVTIIQTPTLPDKEDYLDTWNCEEGEEPEFDEDSYNHDMQEYKNDLAEFEAEATKETTKKGLTFSFDEWKVIFYSTEQKKSSYNANAPVTAKEVQEAIKAGTVTIELLTAEIARINAREERAKEIDRDKIQSQVHEQFLNQQETDEQAQKPTAADLVCARLVIYQSLDYSVRNAVNRVLFADTDFSNNGQFYEALANMPEQQYAFLIRMAVARKSESKYPTNVTAYALYEMAKASGLDVAAIEQAQEEKAKERQDKMELRIKELEKRIGRLEMIA
ncbi:ParB/RepB/Spo0J family partition protein [Pedobacter sp. ISL-68]|uniref:ParB/RepB/Spo0J family partition protein n=1 Tax=unclassified Pedobacter TaxID=2628915 RepID=UPI001BE7EC72|nr:MULTISPECIES: ParB/RepB/Spo0J family partition protein [unclassified Pedobacter]MBT2561331.1 ParB/RepB/Spo0J family partition protein [Pedobacter sp. ISL-64]MBT2590720.1 ParB/RepB/Spo0J family partition protein [Pedobacter sp. ISL-68]